MAERTREQLRAIFAKYYAKARRVFRPPVKRVTQSQPTKIQSKPKATGTKTNISRNTVDEYLRKATKTPLLTEKEEKHLGKLVKSGTDKEKAFARKRLIESNTRLVVSMAKKQQWRGLPLEDIIQEGNIGLIKAAETYDPSKGTRFATHASKWIKQSMTRAFEQKGDEIRSPSNVYWSRIRLNQAATKFTQKYGREPTASELVAITGLTTKQINKSFGTKPKYVSLDKRVGGDDDDAFSLQEVMADSSPGPHQRLVDKERAETESDLVKLMIKRLTPLERRVILKKYGFLDRYEKPMSGAQIGRELKLSKQRVQQIEVSAMRKMRGSQFDKIMKFLEKNQRQGRRR